MPSLRVTIFPHVDIHSIPPPALTPYQEFMRSQKLSVGVYRLEAGALDAQQPHTEDEIYYVLSGRAKFTSGTRTVDVEAGACLFVPSGERHRFHDILEPLEALVVFGPAEVRRPTADPRSCRYNT